LSERSVLVRGSLLLVKKREGGTASLEQELVAGGLKFGR